jgi:hypothetical protein
MRTSTTNRLLTTTLRTLCCVGALTACSAWATVVTWQVNPSGGGATAQGIGNAPSTDTSHEYSFRSAPESAVARPDDSLLFASNTSVRPATELDEAMAKTFDEEFVSVPTIQFAATAPGSQAATMASMAATTSGPGPMPVPEMSALFPIVGLIAAVSCTQILRRRRAAQQSGSRTVA